MTSAVVVALGAVVALLAVLVVGLLRSHAEILRALHDLGVNLEEGAPSPRASTSTSRHAPLRTAPGVPAPRSDGTPMGPAADITGTMPGGGAAHVAVVGVGHPTLLAFLSTGCGTCGHFWDALRDDGAVERLPDPATRLVIVTNGPDAESPPAVADVAPPGLLTVMSSEAWDDYGVPVSPYFVLVDGVLGRVIGEGSGTSWHQVADLLGKAMADGAASAPPPARTPSRAGLGGQDRADLVDRQLRDAGVEPGDPSLYPPSHPSRAGDGP